MLHFFKTSVVGSEWGASRHRKILTFEGTFSFHSELQEFSSLCALDDPLRPSNHSTRCSFVLSKNLYAEQTENFALLARIPSPKIFIVISACGYLQDRVHIYRQEHRTHQCFIPCRRSWRQQFRHHSWWICNTGRHLSRRGFLWDQMSVQMFVVWPLPIRQIIPCLSKSHTSRIALQILEGLAPSSASRILLFGKNCLALASLSKRGL